jgi:hypothetical protein
MNTTRRTPAQQKADRRYLDQLAVHLQNWYVPGDRIGEILAEAEAHAAASGEPLREAFGDPKEYARQWAVPPGRKRWRRIVPIALLAALGGFTLAWGATAIALDQSVPVLGLPPWVALVLGFALSLAGLALAPLNRIRDPRTGALRGPSRLTLMSLAALMCAVVAAAGAVGALLR